MASKKNYDDGLPTSFNGPKSKSPFKEHEDNLAFGTNFDLVFKHPDCEEDPNGIPMTQPLRMLKLKHDQHPNPEHVHDPSAFFLNQEVPDEGEEDMVPVEDEYENPEIKDETEPVRKRVRLYRENEKLRLVKNNGAASYGTVSILFPRKRKRIAS